MNRNYAIMGKSYEKKDARDKALGLARFAGDLSFPHMLYGGVFRSTIAHGVIKKFDASKALAIDGVACVLTSRDIPGKNRIGIILKDEPILVDDKIRRQGDAIAVVAAETPEKVREALDAIKIEYTEYEAVLTMERAAEEDSPKIHGDTNVHQTRHLEHGNVDEAFKKCDVIVENDYESPMLSHMFIEPDAGICTYEDGKVTMYCSTQNPHYDRGEVAGMLGIPLNRVSNIQAATGGGFGGKLDISVQCHMALLAFLPMWISWYVVQGWMAIFGLEFNLLNIVISTFIFGVGVDYSIFVMQGLLSGARGKDDKLLQYHKTAIFFSAFVLLVVILSLLLARHPAIRSIGWCSLIGMGSTILITYTLQPLLFRLLMRIPMIHKSIVK